MSSQKGMPMRTLFRSCSIGLLAATALAHLCTLNGNAQTAQPSITTIHPQGTNLLVDVAVPAGLHRVTLEARTRFGSGTWAPVAVGQNDGTATTLRFKVGCSKQAELMRVRAEAQQALPSSFYTGTNSFVGPLDTTGSSAGAPGGVVGVNSGGPTPAGGDFARTVVESDIWQIDGNRLYFFNQYRGLQVIDISTPDQAKVLGTLDLPAAGEQMYLADSNHLVLLANSSCGYGSPQSEALIVDVSSGIPFVVTNLALSGYLGDSRMVGTALYLSTQEVRPVSGSTNATWEWGTVLTSFDLSNPVQPVLRSTLWFPGYGNVVSATDTYLFVATQDPTNWWQSDIQIVDVTATDGHMNATTQVRAAGRVPDKFKLNYTNGVFTCISENWHWNSGTDLNTKLETFRLPDPRSMGPGDVTKLGELELGSGEQLHATRFDGNLVYVVTFFQIDPLWVVDLSEPAKPHIAGSVNVPGWSSYILPLGDRLVAVGVESNRVAVSLFDVHNPSQPSSSSHLLLGLNYSWSDANDDEKAFTVLPEQGLILVPYNGDTTNGWTSRVQLIDLTRTNLVARGVIEHQCQPRRTAYAQDRILSISGWELLSVDATDRDHPNVKGETPLAWSVDRVLATEDYLLELSSSVGWYGLQTSPTVRVTPLHQHEDILNAIALTNVPIVGAGLKDGRLYVAQSQSYGYWYLPPLDGSGVPGTTNQPNFFLTVLDTTHLPELPVLGQTAVQLDAPGWGQNWNAVWSSQNEMVWAPGASYFLPIVSYGGGVVPAGVGMANVVWWPWWGSPGGQLLAFDVKNPTKPHLDSEVNLTTNGGWAFSQTFASGTKAYLSHTTSEVQTNSTYPDGIWLQRYWLDVVDYADPETPTLRPPVNIPGALQGLSYNGELLYTFGLHWSSTSSPDWTQWLDAAAYDGVSAHLIDSLALSPNWPRPLLVVDTNVFIGNPGSWNSSTNFSPALLQTWNLSGLGKFALSGATTLNQPASDLKEANGLVAAREIDGTLEIFDDASASNLSRIGYDQPTGCLWYDLSQATGSAQQGIWIPLGFYGIKEIPLNH
jgi:hypothetical protein